MAALLIDRRAGRCAHGVTSRPAPSRFPLSPPAPEATPAGSLREDTLRYRQPHVQGECARTMYCGQNEEGVAKVLMSSSLCVSLTPHTPSASERHHDAPGCPLSPLPRDCYRLPWPDAARPATLPLPRATVCRTHLPPGLELSRPIADGEGANRYDGDACQWDSRYHTRRARQYQHRHDRTQKKEADLQQVNQAILQVMHPEQVTVEMCRSEALDRRRGRTSERDEM
jgi:hypothetical protein